jgi:hypothetical protein
VDGEIVPRPRADKSILATIDQLAIDASHGCDKTGYCCELIQYPTTLGPVRRAYRPAIAATNSSRAAMLIRLNIGPPINKRPSEPAALLLVEVEGETHTGINPTLA